MANTVTLDSIRAAANAKYGSYDIAVDESTTVKLRNPLRLSKDERATLRELQERINAEPEEGQEAEDQGDLMAEAIRLVADHKPSANKMLREIGDDLAVLVQIFEGYIEGAQVGEASASAS